MKLPIRDMSGETDIQAEPLERPALALPRLKHTDRRTSHLSRHPRA
jgi:hypothetical protein